MALTAGETWANTGLGGALGVGSSQQGHSESQYTNVSDSWGSSGSSAYNVADSWSDSWGDSYGWSNGYSEGSSGSSQQDVTYGREATAKDIELAAEQNALQRSLWNEAADYNAKQAQLDREFQERMSNTSYQRAVKDLLAAGLNPILAVGNMGASTPVGAMGAMSSSNAYRANVTAQREGYGSSSSRSYSRSQSQSGSHNESHSGSHAEGSSSSWSSQGSHSEGQGTSSSDWAPYAKEAVDAVGKMVNAGAKTAKDIINSVANPTKEQKQNSNAWNNTWKDVVHRPVGSRKPYKS